MYHTKKDKRSIQSCDRIFKALEKLSNHKSFEDITIKEIIEEAQVARATFYRNFDHKEDILTYQVDKKFIALKEYLYKYYSENQEVEMTRTYFIVPFLHYWYTDSSLIKLLIKLKKIRILRDAFHTLLLDEIQNHQPEPIDSNDYGYFLAMRSGIAINVLVHWVNTGMKDSPEQISIMLTLQMGSVMNQTLFGKPNPFLEVNPKK